MVYDATKQDTNIPTLRRAGGVDNYRGPLMGNSATHRAPRTAHRAPRTAHRAPRTAHRIESQTLADGSDSRG